MIARQEPYHVDRRSPHRRERNATGPTGTVARVAAGAGRPALLRHSLSDGLCAHDRPAAGAGLSPTKTGRLPARDVTSPDVVISDVAIDARPGLTLHGWRFHPPGALPTPGALPEGEPRLLVLYFPGNGGCRRDRISDCRDFTQLGCEVLLFDYRGYGENGGSPSEANIAADARRVWAYATQELQFPPARILVFGESLGGAVATRLVAELSRGGESPAALLLNSTFSSLADVVRWHYPAIPLQ